MWSLPPRPMLRFPGKQAQEAARFRISVMMSRVVCSGQATQVHNLRLALEAVEVERWRIASSGAGYSNTMSYTHLGQLWQGPLNGSGTSLEYLYCSSSHPHQLTGLYPTGTTCSNLSGAVYTSSYDAWGNVTSRTYSSTTAT